MNPRAAKTTTLRLMLCLVTQSRPALCDPVDCGPPGSSVHGDSPGKNTGVGCHAILRGGSSQPRDQTQVSHIAGRFFTSEPPGKPKNTGVGSLSLLQRVFLTQELNQGLLHCRQILYQLSYREAPTLSLKAAEISRLAALEA